MNRPLSFFRAFVLLCVAAASFAQTTFVISQTASGTITASNSACTATSCVYILAPFSAGSASVQLSGTFTGTLQFEASVDGVVWSSIASTSGSTSSTSAGLTAFNLAGSQYLRVRASALGSGTVTVGIGTSAADAGASGGGAAWGSITGTLSSQSDLQTALNGKQALATVTVSTSGPVTVSTGGFYFNNASGALTYNLPTITTGSVGSQFCFRNSPTNTGAITLQSPASTFIDNAGANGSSAGTFVSSGALGDAACVVAISTTQYAAYPSSGGWVNN